MGVAVWQAIDGMRNSLAEEAKEEKAALKEMTDVWGALRTEEADPGKSREAAATAARLAAILARVSDTLCRDQDADWFNRSPLAVDILHGARDACSRYSDSNMPSCGWLLNMSDPFAAGPRASCLTAGVTLAEISGRGETCTPYWGYDYRRDALPQCAHPNDPMAQARLAEVRRQRAVAGVEVLPAHVSLPEARDGVCAGVTLAPRVHSQDDKEKVNAHIPAWLDTGVRIAATESLSARARMAGLAPPVPSPVTRLQYHANVPRACALQLAQAARAQGWAIEPAPPKFRSLPGHVELWMQASARPQTPPAAAPAASQASTPMLNVTAIVVAAPCAATQACCPSRPVAQTRRIRKPPAAPEKNRTASKTTAETPSPADGTTCPQTAAAAPAMPAASAY